MTAIKLYSILTTSVISMLLSNGQNSSIVSFGQESFVQTKSNNFIKITITSDSSYYKNVYTFTDSTFTLNFIGPKNKDNYVLKIIHDNKAFIQTIANSNIKSNSIQNSFYSNLQVIEVNYNAISKKVNVNDFSIIPINLIREKINKNIPSKLKEYKIR